MRPPVRRDLRPRSGRITTTVLAMALLLALPVGAAAQDGGPAASLDLPETITPGDPTDVGFTFTNDDTGEITDARLVVTLRVPGDVPLDEVTADVEVTSSNASLDGTAAELEANAAALTASLPDDGFTVAAEEQIDTTLTVTLEGSTVDADHQLEVGIVGERDGESVLVTDFDTFTLVDDDTDRPDRVDAGSGGLVGIGGAARTEVWLPVAMTILGGALLLGAVASGRPRKEH